MDPIYKTLLRDAMMKKMMMYAVITIFLGCAGLLACSNSNNAEPELESQKGVIEEMTDNAAKKAVNRIRSPLDKARSVADQEQDRLNDMDQSSKD
ncbi:MAG: hypothetical protein KJP06_03520 [Deltaproteobacteria bacterium]|nr:hypothetical protein [Deltaproteobacteria bacterium]